MKYASQVFEYINRNRYFLAFLVCIHALYFGCALHFKGIYNADSIEYLDTAVNLSEHGEVYNYTWSDTKRSEFYTLRPPVYGIFISIFKLIGNSDFIVLFFQNVLSFFSWIFFIRILKELGLQANLQLTVILVLLFFPIQMIMVNCILADHLLQVWLLLSFGSIVFYLKTNKPVYILLHNILLVLAVMTKPVMMYFWIPNLFFCIYLFFIHKRQMLVLVSSLLLPLSVFFWCSRNESKTGSFHFSSIKTQNILDLNAGGVLSILEGDERADSIKKSILISAESITNYKERTEYITSSAIEIIQNNKCVYAYVHAKGMVNFMLSFGMVDMLEFVKSRPQQKDEISLVREIELNGFEGLLNYFQETNLLKLLCMFSVVLCNVVMLASTVCFGFNRSFNPIIRIYVLVLIVYVCFVCGPGGYARLKMCIMPLMLLNMPTMISFIKNRFLPQN